MKSVSHFYSLVFSAVLVCFSLGFCVEAQSIGAFRAGTPIPVNGQYPVATSGDFDGDGKPDLAVLTTTAVEVFRGKGDGTFYDAVTTLGDYSIPAALASADLNGDGRSDLVVSVQDVNLQVLISKGDGTFQTGPRLSGFAGVVHVSIADVNGDGRPDLVTADLGSKVRTYLGKGDGTFLDPISTGGFGGEPVPALILRDFNGDGKLDLGVGVDTGFSLWLGLGDGTFERTASYRPAQTLTGVTAAADFNGDGNLDVIVLASIAPQAVILPGDGKGHLGAPVVISPPDNTTFSSLVVADFDQDGKLDIVFVTDSGGAVLYRGKGGFAFEWIDRFTRAQDIVGTADFNLDGKPDLIETGTSQVLIALNTLTANPSPCTYTVDPIPTLPATGGMGFARINTSGGCPWQLSTATDGLVLLPPSGQGSGQFAYLVQPNGSRQARTLRITTNFGLEIQFTQAGSAQCTVFLPDAGVTIGPAAQLQNVLAIAELGCGGQASTTSPWIHIFQSDWGTGSILSLSIDANTTRQARSGVIKIADRGFVVVQLAGTVTAGTRFVPIPPCRAMDTRIDLETGMFGPGFLYGSRTVSLSLSGCNVPATARAYSLNLTAVPYAPLGYLRVWPAGRPAPPSSNLNSPTGAIVANSAIVEAGAGGAITFFATDPTDLVVDINGYFVGADDPTGLVFYPVTPCRVLDSRYTPPSFGDGTRRVIAMRQSNCGLPASAAAYALNFTVVPNGKLGYLTVWPTGQAQPFVSTLNSREGRVVANGAIVPSGTDGNVSVFTAMDSGTTDLIVDVNGYFAPPGPGGVSYYPVTPCRAFDSRGTFEPFTRTSPLRSIPMGAPCGPGDLAKAWATNVTAVPTGLLGYLSIWPSGQTQPFVSTLNSYDGRIAANAAIVPAGTGGALSVYTDLGTGVTTHVILDVFGYFAP